MSRFLIHSDSGDGVGLAVRLEREGHDVSLFIKDEGFRGCGEGMVTHVSSIKEGLNKSPEAIIFDMSGDGDTADDLKKAGHCIIGAGKFNDLIEHDRSFGMRLCQKAGIAVPPYEVFKKTEVAKAISFIKKSGKRYVLKPDNNLALDLTYLAKDPEDMEKYLSWCQEQGILKGDFLLQEFVEGVEISTEVWFSRGKPLSRPNGTMEVKKFMAGNLGPATGCESSVVWPYSSLDTPIVEQTIAKIYPILEQMGYTGPLDINAIVSEGTAYFLEFTPRFGYSALYALIELLPYDLGEFLGDVAYGEATEIAMDDAFAMALTLSVPPYPLASGKPETKSAFDVTRGRAVVGLDLDHFFPYDLYAEGDDLFTGGMLGLLGYLTAIGSSLDDVNDNVYADAKEVQAPDLQYRIDGIDRVREDLPELESMGFEVPDFMEVEV